MKRNGTGIYALAVCFIAVIGVAVTSVVVIYNTLGAIVPRFTIHSYQVDSYESDESYTRYWPKDKPIPSGPELAAMRKAEYEGAIRRERHSSVQNLTIGLIIIVVALLLFVIHWRLHVRAKLAHDVA